MPVDLIDRADAERPAQATPNPGAADADGSDGDDGAMSVVRTWPPPPPIG